MADKTDNSSGKSRTIKVDYMARVEGESGLDITILNDRVEDVKLRIFEPPRFFEGFMRGRKFADAPDITARICGICPVAYQMSSAHAMEQALGVSVGGPLRELRRLIYCGEWIESHVLHVYLLHTPDFLGYQDAMSMAKDYPDVVEKGLRLKKTGNEIVQLLGGREIHPINVKVGGFYKVPTKQELGKLRDKLEPCLDLAREMIEFTSRLDFPDFLQDYEFISLRHKEEYPFNEGRLVSNKGLDFDIAHFDEYIVEEHVPHSTSLHANVRTRGSYLVGPMARYHNCYDKLSDDARALATAAGLGKTCDNPFQSIVVRAVETYRAVEEAIRIIDAYEMPGQPSVDIEPRAGVGYGCTEAPRGILYHRYELDDEGLIKDAVIVPPTSQNQGRMEADLRSFVAGNLGLTNDDLQWKCEQAVRNYDPCISCSCHFLKVKIDRDGEIYENRP
jgi:coenzyme F420-reducing hydrogenase alpha subunit